MGNGITFFLLKRTFRLVPKLLIKPIVDSTLVEAPLFAHLLSGDAATLCEFMERRFRNLEVASQFIEVEDFFGDCGHRLSPRVKDIQIEW
mgnify:CR=1 FL=1